MKILTQRRSRCFMRVILSVSKGRLFDVLLWILTFLWTSLVDHVKTFFEIQFLGFLSNAFLLKGPKVRELKVMIKKGYPIVSLLIEND